jgi:hypothetical protein
MAGDHQATIRKLQSELAKLRAAQKSPPIEQQPIEPMLRTWAIALGIPTAIFTTGLAVVPFDFWIGVGAAYFGCVVYLVDAIWFGRKAWFGDRALICTVPLAAIFLLTFLAFRPASFLITGLPMPGAYKADTKIAGITWKANYSEIRLILENKSGTSFTNATILVRSDLLIAHVGAMDPAGSCKGAPTLPGVEMAGSVVSRLGNNGEIEESFPGFSENSVATVFRITCDRLAAGRSTELIVAFEGPQPRTPPSWISADAEYEAYGRERTTSARQCLVGKCPAIPDVNAGGATIRQ